MQSSYFTQSAGHSQVRVKQLGAHNETPMQSIYLTQSTGHSQVRVKWLGAHNETGA